MRKPWTGKKKLEMLHYVLTMPQKRIRVTVEVSILANLDPSSEEGEKAIRDLIANEFYTLIFS